MKNDIPATMSGSKKEMLQINENTLKGNPTKEIRNIDISTCSPNVRTVLKNSEKLRIIKSQKIDFAKPLLSQNDQAVIFPNTINVIQGQAGVHKSRLAENICSALLKKEGCVHDNLGFKKNENAENHTVVYVDTERNISEQFAHALQSIQKNSGYEIYEDPEFFKYTSLLQIARKERYDTLQEYIKNLKETINTPLFIVLDVSTDCIEDFNKVDKSLELIDLMNVMINTQDVVFLCIIHENPGGSKARGHFGTELMNKASTVIQVAFEQDLQKSDTDLIRVKYLKCRSTAKHPSFYITFSEDSGGLILADNEQIFDARDNRRTKAKNEDIISSLKEILKNGNEVKKADIITPLILLSGASERTIEERIKEIVVAETEILNDKDEPCILVKDKSGKEVTYKLVPLHNSEPSDEPS